MTDRIVSIVVSAVVGLAAGALGAFLVIRADTGVETASIQTPPPTNPAAVRMALMQNPGMVRDALIELQRIEQQAEADLARDRIGDFKDEIYNSPHDHAAGNPEGSVTVVEFFDYNCPYCKRAHTDMKALLEQDSDVRFVLKEFPILGEGSMQVARLAVAASRQGKYMEFHDALFEWEGRLDANRGLQIAEEIGLDTEKLQQDAASGEVANIIAGNINLAGEIGVNGTPGYVVGDELIPGAIGAQGLAQKVEDARKRAEAAK